MIHPEVVIGPTDKDHPEFHEHCNAFDRALARREDPVCPPDTPHPDRFKESPPMMEGCHSPDPHRYDPDTPHGSPRGGGPLQRCDAVAGFDSDASDSPADASDSPVLVYLSPSQSNASGRENTPVTPVCDSCAP